MISKYIITSVFVFTSALAVMVIGWSVGFYLPIFAVVLVPTLIMHVIAGIRAYQQHPAWMLWILISGVAFLIFSLYRPDEDAHGPFTGYSALFFRLGLTETEHTTPWPYALELALVSILVQIFVNTHILRSTTKKKVS